MEGITRFKQLVNNKSFKTKIKFAKKKMKVSNKNKSFIFSLSIQIPPFLGGVETRNVMNFFYRHFLSSPIESRNFYNQTWKSPLNSFPFSSIRILSSKPANVRSIILSINVTNRDYTSCKHS